MRTDKNRQPLHDETLKGGPTGTIGVLHPIAFGGLKIEEEIKTAASEKLAGFGIAVLDFRIKRVNYDPEVLDRIYQRMISERLQIAQRFRSEGEGESTHIAGQRERDLNGRIQSNAYRQVQQIRGEADAKATEIYARAYTQNEQAAEFYAFLKTPGDLSQNLHQRFRPGALDGQRHICPAKTRRHENKGLPDTARDSPTPSP